MSACDVAILGSGPVAHACALACARAGQRALLLARTERHRVGRGLESVPAGLLALLVELGVTPADAGVTTLATLREVAWREATPVRREGPAAGHVDRALLDGALEARMRGARRIERRVARRHDVTRHGGAWRGEGWRAGALIDATGRAAATAVRRERPEERWAATLWTVRARETGHPGDDGLALAVLRTGYLYRLGHRDGITLGLVTPLGAPRSLELACEAARRDDAGWILGGLHLEGARPLGTRVASVEWAVSTAPRSVLIGDAALARDALSSQGLACGLSEALHAAAAIGSAKGLALLAARQGEQRQAHLAAMTGLLATCRFRDEPPWSRYLDWLERRTAADGSTARARVALREGRLASVSG